MDWADSIVPDTLVYLESSYLFADEMLKSLVPARSNRLGSTPSYANSQVMLLYNWFKYDSNVASVHLVPSI